MGKEKDSPTSLEWLMTYGWALLIIVVVGSALYVLGVFNPATYGGGEWEEYCEYLENITVENEEAECNTKWYNQQKHCGCDITRDDERGIHKVFVYYIVPEKILNE